MEVHVFKYRVCTNIDSNNTQNATFVGLTKQNKLELVLKTQNCIESIVTCPHIAADSLDKAAKCEGLHSYPFQFQFRTQSTNYLMIAGPSTRVISVRYLCFLVTFREIF